MAGAALELHLAGPSGEPVDLWRTIVSHGVAALPPGAVDEDARAYETTVPLAGARARTIRIRPAGRRRARVDVLGPRLSEAGGKRVGQAVRTLLNLDEDLSGFYEVAASDPELSWAAAGAGRMLRGATVFEDVVKTDAGDAKLSSASCHWRGMDAETWRFSGFADVTSTRISNASEVLLLDDVYTSGYSMFDAARALRAAGASSVVGVVYARRVFPEGMALYREEVGA